MKTALTLLFICEIGLAVPPWEAANPIAPLPKVPVGLGTQSPPLRVTPKQVRLGRWLFFDKRLSLDGTVSCVSCHVPEKAFSVATAFGQGVHGQKTARKPPPILNVRWAANSFFFWDGRAQSLPAQALGPLTNPAEMGMSASGLVERLSRISSYPRYFREAFGSRVITIERVTQALSAYELTRMSGNSPFDRWQKGDEKAVSDDVKLGLRAFFGFGCAKCHSGPNFSDNQFHNTGVGFDLGSQKFKDSGRFSVTTKPEDAGAFKTPSLRNLKERAPYMHDGSIATLNDVVLFYVRGGIRNPNIDPQLSQFRDLPFEEWGPLVKFLEALEGSGFEDHAPAAFPQ